MECPHCRKAFHPQFETAHANFNVFQTQLFHQNCPACSKPIVEITATRAGSIPAQVLIQRHTVYPLGKTTRNVSDDIPEPYRQTFIEADLTLSISPMASASLSRRIIQALLRAKAATKSKDLYHQIEEVIESKTLPPYISEELHAARNVGNFAAHEIRDQQTGDIIGVEPGEAEWTLNVAGGMLDFYFVEPANAARRKLQFNEKLKAGGKPLLQSNASDVESIPPADA